MIKNKQECDVFEDIGKAVGARSTRNQNSGLPKDFFDFLAPSSFHDMKESDRALIAIELKRRGITELVHFTSKSNLQSIKELGGILSKKQLSKQSGVQYSITDEDRADRELDGISVSITRPNIFMLKQKIKNGQIKDPYIIKIKPELLLDPNIRFIFCEGNAARFDGKKGSKYEDFLRMFQDTDPITFISRDGEIQSKTREELTRKNNETTDGQAEILVEGKIPFKYIIGSCEFDAWDIYD